MPSKRLLLIYETGSRSSARQAQVDANKICYVWDAILEGVLGQLAAGTYKSSVEGQPMISRSMRSIVVRVMALELRCTVRPKTCLRSCPRPFSTASARTTNDWP
jgi:hypothetical protein